MKTISIFIRAKNEADELGKTLLEINRQERKPLEIVVLDNDSKDETREIASRCGARVEKLSDSQFSYGRALNQSLKHTKGEIIVFLSAHSPPCHTKWLEELVRPIEKRVVEVTFGRQIPISGVNVFEEWFVRRAFPGKLNSFLEMMSLQKVEFSNGNAALTRTLLEKHPFREDLSFAEDVEWSDQVENQGILIEYCPRAAVHHSHVFGPGELRRRMISVGQAMKKRGYGDVYQNPLTCFVIQSGTMLIDFFYCLTRGYLKEIAKISSYRKEFFGGIREGLR